MRHTSESITAFSATGRSHIRRLASFATLAALFVAGCESSTPADNDALTSIDSLTASYSAEECASCEQWNLPHEPFQIFGNTYYVGTDGLASILVTSDTGHILIDGGLPDSAPLIEANIRALGFDPADVEIILNSHAHFDHAGGVAALQRATGAGVIASPPSAVEIRNGDSGPDDPQYGVLLSYPAVDDVRELAFGEPVTLGDLSLTPHSTPGHTAGGTTWTWRVCEESVCMNLVYADSQTPISADGYRFTDRTDLDSFERGYALLETLTCDILITPHPSASSFWERRGSTDGLVDSDACQQYAASARELLARRLEAERAQ